MKIPVNVDIKKALLDGYEVMYEIVKKKRWYAEVYIQVPIKSRSFRTLTIISKWPLAYLDTWSLASLDQKENLNSNTLFASWWMYEAYTF